MFNIIIEGNIGSGKSALTKALALELNARTFMEPVKENPFLELFYKNPKKYAMSMQWHLLCERYEMHMQGIQHVMSRKQSVVFDRSIWGDIIFCEKNYEDGNISFIDFQTYCKMKALLVDNNKLLVPCFTIYLETDPEINLINIKKRGRECEKGITLDYLQGINNLYDTRMRELEKLGTNLIRINWNEFGTVETVIKRMGIEAVGKTVPSEKHDELQEKYDNLNWMMEGLRK